MKVSNLFVSFLCILVLLPVEVGAQCLKFNKRKQSLAVVDARSDGTCGRKTVDLLSFLQTIQSETGLQGPQGEPGPQGPAGPQGEPAATYFAVVTYDGNLERGIGVESVTKAGIGRYDVEFDSDITECVAFATVGRDGTSMIPALVSTTIGFLGNDTRVRVRVEDYELNPYDRPFYLAVFC